MAVHANVDLLCQRWVAVQTLVTDWPYEFVVNKIQCHAEINRCFYYYWNATGIKVVACSQHTGPNTYLLSHDVCSLHDTLGQKSMTSSQYGCLLQGHT